MEELSQVNQDDHKALLVLVHRGTMGLAIITSVEVTMKEAAMQENVMKEFATVEIVMEEIAEGMID